MDTAQEKLLSTLGTGKILLCKTENRLFRVLRINGRVINLIALEGNCIKLLPLDNLLPEEWSLAEEPGTID